MQIPPRVFPIHNDDWNAARRVRRRECTAAQHTNTHRAEVVALNHQILALKRLAGSWLGLADNRSPATLYRSTQRERAHGGRSFDTGSQRHVSHELPEESAPAGAIVLRIEFAGEREHHVGRVSPR